MAMPPVLVTGACGRLGSQLVQRLAAQGRRVLATDRAAAPTSATALWGEGCEKHVEFARAELGDRAAVDALVARSGAILHVGAVPGPAKYPPPGVDPSWSRSTMIGLEDMAGLEVVQQNLMATCGLFEAAARQRDGRRVVFSSSLFAMGYSHDPGTFQPKYLPLDEEHEPHPLEHYGFSKASAEAFAGMLVRADSDLAGAEPSAKRHKADTASFVMLRFSNIVKAEKWADFPAPTPDLRMTPLMWAYCHEHDVIEAHLRALDLPQTALPSRCESFLLVADDTRFDIPTAQLIREHWSNGGAPPLKKQLPGFTSIVSNQKAKNLLGFAPRSCRTPSAAAAQSCGVTTLVFDIDDTMYPVSSGFSDHRNGPVVSRFMVEKLGFSSTQEAKKLRDEYFTRFHSTMKGLNVATAEGRLPKPFVQEELGDFWAEHCDYERYLAPDAAFVDALRSLRDDAGLTLVAFSNSPRKYALRCLDTLGVREFFPDDRVFGVEDVLPACKPEREAFLKVLGAVGARPEQAVMFEDSMKNVRACKAAGLRTVLIHESTGAECGGEAALLGDIPRPEDPAVDVVIRRVGEIRDALPGLWQRRFVPSTGTDGERKWDIFAVPSGFVTKNGESLDGGFVAYKTHGTLNAEKTNVILHPTSFDATHWELECNIGPGKLLDTTRYFVVVVNLLGNGVSFSPSTCAPGQRFPKQGTTMCDNVRLQALLLDSLGISTLELIYGYSMGAMQAFHWGVMFPARVRRIAAVCGSARASDYNVVFLDSLEAALRADVDLREDADGNLHRVGSCVQGLKAFGRIYAGWGVPMEFYRRELWRGSSRDGVPFQSREDFVVRSYEGGFSGAHPLNLLAQIQTWRTADVSKAFGLPAETDLKSALARVSARTYVAPCTTDSYFTVAEVQAEAELLPRARFLPIESFWGHRAGDPHRPGQEKDARFLADAVGELLREDLGGA